MIDGHALAERLRCSGSRSDLRISPLALRYLSPRTVPSVAIDGCKPQARECGPPRWNRIPKPAGTLTRLSRVGPKASTTPMPHSVDTSTFHGWTFSRQEDALSTLSFPGCQQRWAPLAGKGDCSARDRVPLCPWPVWEAWSALACSEAGFRQERFSPSTEECGSRDIPPRVESSTTKAGPRPEGPSPTETAAGHSADLHPGGRLQVF